MRRKPKKIRGMEMRREKGEGRGGGKITAMESKIWNERKGKEDEGRIGRHKRNIKEEKRGKDVGKWEEKHGERQMKGFTNEN